MIWRYKAIPIEYVKESPSIWKRLWESILFWRKKTPRKGQIAINWVDDITTEGLIEAPSKEAAIMKLMYYNKLYTIDIYRLENPRDIKIAKRVIRLSSIRSSLEDNQK